MVVRFTVSSYIHSNKVHSRLNRTPVRRNKLTCSTSTDERELHCELITSTYDFLNRLLSKEHVVELFV